MPRLAGEEVDSYVKRRGRAARKICVERGLWSHHWFNRAIQWDEHLSRPRNMHSWAARLREYRGKQWLIDRRVSLAPADSSNVSIFAGRTGTRSFQGCVHTRWHDSIDYARANCASP